MIIREIELHNIRSHTDTRLSLGPGTYLIEGDIGAGKTSILMGIEFALFGSSTSELYGELMRSGATDSYVRVVFEHGGRKYEIFRSLRRNNGRISNDRNYIVVDGVEEVISPSDIQRRFLGILGIDVGSSRKKSLPIVTYAIYTPQEMMKSILTGRPDERMGIIRKIFRLDQYRNAVENTKIVHARVREESRILKEWKEELARSTEELEEYKTKNEELRAALKEQRARYSAMERECAGVSEMLDDMNARRENYEKLKKRIRELEVRAESVNSEIKSREYELADIRKIESELKNLESDAKRYEELLEDSEKLRDELSALAELRRGISRKKGVLQSMLRDIENAGDFESEIKRLRAELESIQSEMESLGDVETELTEVDARIMELVGEIKRFKGELSNREEELSEYRGLEGVCPVCKRPLTEEHKAKLIEEVAGSIEALKRKIGMLSRELGSANVRKRELQKKEARLRELGKMAVRVEGELNSALKRKEELDGKRAEAEKLQKELGEIELAIEPLEEKSRIYEEMLSEIKRLKPLHDRYISYSAQVARIPELEKKIAELRDGLGKIASEIDSLKKEVLEINYDEEEHRRITEKCEALRLDMARLSESMTHVTENIGENVRAMEQLHGRMEELRDKIALSEKIIEVKNWIDSKFVSALHNIEKERLSEINAEFRELFEEWFYELLGESDYSATIDDEFSPHIKTERGDMPIKSLSGGERTSVALAYRLALNAMVKRALGLDGNLLILDEPTDGFSKDQLYKLKDVLEKMDTEQIIIVSHETELRNLADTIIRVEKKDMRSSLRII